MSFNPFLAYLEMLEIEGRSIVLHHEDGTVYISKDARVYVVRVEGSKETTTIFCGPHDVEGYYLRYGGVPFNETT